MVDKSKIKPKIEEKILPVPVDSPEFKKQHKKTEKMGIDSNKPKENKELNLDFEDPESIVRDIEQEELAKLKEKSIEKINTKSKWDNLKLLSKKYYEQNGIFRIFINKEVELKGKVTHKVFDSIQQISLMKECLVKIGDEYGNKIYFFDEGFKKIRNIVDSYEEEFWIYKFKSNKREYLLLVKKDEEIDLEEYIIEGTLVRLPDYADVGNYTKLDLSIPIIFVHTAKKRITKFKNNKELFEKIRELKLNNKDILSKYLFSYEGIYYQNPEQYQEIIKAWLFSCKKNGYPLHIIIVGPQGTGKSKIIESLNEKSGEIGGIFEGTTSTFKKLIPSYKGNLAKPGYVIESNRLCFADEFLRVLMRVDKDDRADYLTFLNTLLEHKKRSMGSGNCDFEGKMTSKMLAVTNPVYGTSSISVLVSNFKESITFFSRLLILYQNREHINFVNNLKENEDKLEKVNLKIDFNDFLSIYDYLNNLECKYNIKKFKLIYNKFKNYLQQNEKYFNLSDMFNARCYHHFSCLLDGIIKKRCIIELDEKFEATEKDYTELEELIKYIFISWDVDMIDNVNLGGKL